MQPMDAEQVRAFVNQYGKTGKLATINKDGRPHCVPVWVSLVDDKLYFMTMKTSQKARNIARDNRVAITFDSEDFPYDFVTIEGTAANVEVNDAELLEISTRIAARYVPSERAEEYGRRNAVPDEALICITPTKVISAAGVAN